MATPPPTGSDKTAAAPADDGQTVTAATIRDRWEKGVEDLSKERRTYWVNRAMVSGDQWLMWNRSLNRLDRIPHNDDRCRFTENRLRQPIRTLKAKLLRRPLSFEVLPTAGDDASAAGSRTASAILADVHRDQDWERVRHDAAHLALIGGVAVVAVEWDAQAGQPLGQNEDTGQAFGTGNVALSALSVVQVATQPGVADLERADWWIKAAALPPGQVQARYGLDKPPAADATSRVSPLQRDGTVGDGNTADLTLVLVYFERPQPPRGGRPATPGRCSVVVGDTVVEDTPWPFPFTDRLNVVVVRESPMDDKWTGETCLSDAVEPQVAVNLARSSYMEHMKNVGMAKPMMPVGAVDEAWSDDPGETIEYNPTPGGGMPTYLSPPAMPAWWAQAHEPLYAAIDDALGVHAISRGEAPSGVDSGVALSLLAEQDDTPIGRMAGEMARAWGRAATLVLLLYEANVHETRTARIRQPAGAAPEEVRWTGKSLAGQTTAEVPEDVAQPHSRTAQLQLAFNLVSHGLLNGADGHPDQARFFEFTEMAGGEDAMQAADPDAAKARRESYEMAVGAVCIPADFDNHPVHVAAHNRFRKTARYEQLDAAARQVIDSHIAAHAALDAHSLALQQQRAAIDPVLATAAHADEPALAGQPSLAPPVPMPGPAPTAPGPVGGPGETPLGPAAPTAAPLAA